MTGSEALTIYAMAWQASGPQHSDVKLLNNALQAECMAVNVFLTRIVTDTLTPVQQAWLDARAPSRPWYPDWWALTGALALEHGEGQVGGNLHYAEWHAFESGFYVHKLQPGQYTSALPNFDSTSKSGILVGYSPLSY